MRLGVIPENPAERIVRRLNLAPRPLVETQMAFTLARLVMVATKLGIFDALAPGPLDAGALASRLGTHPTGTAKLLFALAGAGYIEEQDDGYRLTAMSRKWLVSDSKSSIADKLLFQFLEWDWMESAEDYVRTGAPIELHGSAMSPEGWDLYQRGMRAMAGAFSGEAVRRMPVPSKPTRMLDIGGSHGYYSVALCRKHAGLRAEVLDLPEAVEKAAPILAAEGMGDTVVHVAGDALSRDLGADRYDLVLVSQLVHHFSDQQNHELAAKIAAALKPGGVYAVLDEFRPQTPKEGGQLGSLLEFYFALTSQSGTWSTGEIADWQREAGLQPRRTIRFRTFPGVGIQAAIKPD